MCQVLQVPGYITKATGGVVVRGQPRQQFRHDV
jgi:hypothetical protein